MRMMDAAIQKSLIWINAKPFQKPNFGTEALQPCHCGAAAYSIFMYYGRNPSRIFSSQVALCSSGVAGELREEMLDLVMLALVVAAFAAAAAYAGLCNQLGRRPEMPDEDLR